MLTALFVSLPAFAQDVARNPDVAGWLKPKVAAERLQYRTFTSAAAKAEVSYLIYTPQSYDTDAARRFPVLYWLHGLGGGQQGVPGIVRRFDAAIRAGDAPPMLIVFVNGLAESMWCDAQGGGAPVETVFIRELIPHIDAGFRTITNRHGRAIEGFSMGGFGAAHLGFEHHELFGAVSLLAGALHNERTLAQRRATVFANVFGGDTNFFQQQSPWLIAASSAPSLKTRTLVRQIVGDRDPTLAYNRDFDAHLTRLGVPHAFRVLPGVNHNPNQIYEALGADNWEFFRRAFQTETNRPTTSP